MAKRKKKPTKKRRETDRLIGDIIVGTIAGTAAGLIIKMIEHLTGW